MANSTTTTAPAATPSPAMLASLSSATYSEESERVVCSSMLRVKDDKGDRSTHAVLANLLSQDDFFVEHNKNFWAIASAMETAGMVCDPAAMADSARRQDLEIGGPRYLLDLLDDPMLRASTDAAILDAAKRIKSLALLRRTAESLTRALHMCSKGESAQDVVAFVTDEMANIRSSESTSRTGPRHVAAFADIVMEAMMAKLNNEPVDIGAPTGSPGLDKIIGRLNAEELIVVAARPGMGKTAFAMNIEKACAEANRPTLLFSLEMSGRSLGARHLANRSRIPVNVLKEAALTDRQWGDLTEASGELLNSQCWIDDSPGLGIAEIRARSRAWAAKFPGGVILVDYLQRVAAPVQRGAESEKSAHVGMVSSALKDMARELKVPVVALAQLNRGVEQRTNKRPMMSDLRESGQIEQDAEIIIFLYRDEYYNPDSPERGVCETIVAKNRDGETATVKRGFEANILNLYDLDVPDHV